MKIAFVVTNICSEGGTERVVVNLCNFLAGQPSYSITIHSLASTTGRPFFALDERVDIAHHGLRDYANERSVLWKSYSKAYNSIAVFFALRRIAADIIVGTSKHINIYLVLYRRKDRDRVVGCEHFTHNAPMSGSIRRLRQLAYKKLAALVVLNRFDYAYYADFVPRVELIPNFLFFTPSEPASLEGKLAIAVGRHSIEKGFDTLLEVWRLVVERQPEWRLSIIGSGPLLEEHIRLAEQLGLSGSVAFLPPTHDILDAYRQASIYILSSRTEAFPMALLESMGCGLPAVSFDCDAGPRDMLENGRSGFLIPPGDVGGMATSLDSLMKDTGLRRQMGNNAFQDTKRFCLDNVGFRWVRLFEKITSE